MEKYKSLEEFFSGQDAEKLQQIMAVRKVILSSSSDLTESLKWNAPNYLYKGEDRITFNVMNKQNKVKVVIHMGAKKKEDKKGSPVIADPDELVEWNSDIRGVIQFENLNDINLKSKNFKKLIKNWLNVA
ncbi:DUF1801 domain-containing protein [Candidatus Kaiserbacteria bacterium]|nr:MAG: DUF1801 domain-containing protein [Candidatus Kaiserbacteria bacterium]